MTLFFGGWTCSRSCRVDRGSVAPVVFMLKVYIGIFVLMWIRGTLPRVRIDQLLSLGWKVLMPASLVWIMITGIGIKLFPLIFGGGQ